MQACKCGLLQLSLHNKMPLFTWSSLLKKLLGTQELVPGEWAGAISHCLGARPRAPLAKKGACHQKWAQDCDEVGAKLVMEPKQSPVPRGLCVSVEGGRWKKPEMALDLGVMPSPPFLAKLATHTEVENSSVFHH